MASLRLEAKFKCRWQHRQCSETKFGLSCRVTWGSAAMAFWAFLRYAWIPRMRCQMRLLLISRSLFLPFSECLFFVFLFCAFSLSLRGQILEKLWTHWELLQACGVLPDLLLSRSALSTIEEPAGGNFLSRWKRICSKVESGARPMDWAKISTKRPLEWEGQECLDVGYLEGSGEPLSFFHQLGCWKTEQERNQRQCWLRTD